MVLIMGSLRQAGSVLLEMTEYRYMRIISGEPIKLYINYTRGTGTCVCLIGEG